MTGNEEERELNAIAVSIFGKQWISLGDAEAERVQRERDLQQEIASWAEDRYFADEMGGYFADREGFRDPDKAAQHAFIVQGGFSTPLREAARMIADGGVHEQRARAWMAEKGYTEADLER